MIWSALLLLLGVLAYGAAGARLHEGSQHADGALKSRSWWIGTVLQAAGFGFTLLARRTLPLLIVQACSAAGLGVTAVLQHVSGARRLGRREALALVALLVGLALLGTATIPGPAVAIRPAHLWLLAGCVAVTTAALAVRLPPVVLGMASGLGFSFGAIGARLVIGDAAHPLWIFWQLPLNTWIAGGFTGLGIVLGQVHLTRGLARSEATPVLAPMYLMETVVPTIVGLALLQELPRPHTELLAALGLAITVAGAIQLLHTRQGGRPTPAPSQVIR
ncbi:hypothetical protein AAEX63_11335 [Luteococcus sp. H138]|uniref:hypothetical protein n=1 Tax=unclassified Luteococcus TaxID=2639923 RepID=UPI00313AE2C5